MNHKAFEEKHCETATELWNLLSPTNELFRFFTFYYISYFRIQY